MSYLSFEQLTSPPLATQDVPAPEVGGSVQIRALTVGEQQDIRRAARVGHDLDNDRMEIFLVAASLVSPAVPSARVMELKQARFAVFNRIVAAVMALNGLSGEAAQQAEATFQDGQRDALSLPPSTPDRDDGRGDAPADDGQGV